MFSYFCGRVVTRVFVDLSFLVIFVNLSCVFQLLWCACVGAVFVKIVVGLGRTITLEVERVLGREGVARCELRRGTNVARGAVLDLVGKECGDYGLAAIILVVQTLGVAISRFFGRPMFRDRSLVIRWVCGSGSRSLSFGVWVV